MEIIYFLVPLAFLLGLIFVIIFIWAAKDGQYDDLETPAHRMLLDDEPINNKNTDNNCVNNQRSKKDRV